jgi:Kef-type K+ transport system membrane component KefB
MEPVQLAAILASAALVASIVSVQVGVSVALIELTLGVVLGNAFSLDPNQQWFLRGGMNVSLAAVFANLGILAVLIAAKLVPKLGLVYPLARKHAHPHAGFTTLLMSTGLTFGTISALYGLTAHIIDRTQFSLLLTVVVFSAIVPTAIAQRWLSPPLPAEQPHHLLPPDPSENLIGEAN